MVKKGDTALLQCAVSGDKPINIVWMRSGKNTLNPSTNYKWVHSAGSVGNESNTTALCIRFQDLGEAGGHTRRSVRRVANPHCGRHRQWSLLLSGQQFVWQWPAAGAAAGPGATTATQCPGGGHDQQSIGEHQVAAENLGHWRCDQVHSGVPRGRSYV